MEMWRHEVTRALQHAQERLAAETKANSISADFTKDLLSAEIQIQ